MMTIGQRPGRLSIAPVLSCIDCRRDTNQGRIYPVSLLVWQLLPLCDEHINEPSGSGEPITLSTLQRHIDEQLAMTRHLQCRKHRIARAYMQLRSQRAHMKAQRALRRKLNRAYKLLEVEL